jgi:hypothetical protein
MNMATKQSSKATKSGKNRPKRIPSVKRLDPGRPLLMSMVATCSPGCTQAR